jgi:hypothetical protein
MELVKKITMAGIFGNIKLIVKPMKDGDTKDLLQVFGIANGTKTGESDFGPFTGLRGQFKAKNLLDQKEYVSSLLYLPPVANDLVLGQFVGGTKEVTLGFILSVTCDMEQQIGYVYTAKPLFEPEKNNPLALLESKIGEKNFHKK